MTKEISTIRNIEDKYGLVLFRMALTHLVDVGVRNLTDENVAEAISQIDTSGSNSIMTPEFQCDIVRCASELAKCSIWDLFYYIKKYLIIDER